MILVTVGTHYQGFDQLVEAMDKLAADLEEQVMIQYGPSSYLPQHADSFPFTTSTEMEQLTRHARIVVTLAAAGAIILALKLNKPLVVVPSRKAHNEHFDDHQVQFAEALAEAGMAVTVLAPTPQALWRAIEQAEMLEVSSSGSACLVEALQAQLSQWNEKK